MEGLTDFLETLLSQAKRNMLVEKVRDKVFSLEVEVERLKASAQKERDFLEVIKSLSKENKSSSTGSYMRSYFCDCNKKIIKSKPDPKQILLKTCKLCRATLAPVIVCEIGTFKKGDKKRIKQKKYVTLCPTCCQTWYTEI
jgi:hypothetical protein